MQSTGNDPQDRQRYRLNTKAHPQRRRYAPINTLKKEEAGLFDVPKTVSIPGRESAYYVMKKKKREG